MVSIKIKDVKNFMGKLLTGETFDSFRFVEGNIQTYNTFSIDGKINPAFFSSDEQSELPNTAEEYSDFFTLRPILFSLIKGKRTPLSFRFTLHLSQEKLQVLFPQTSDTLPSLVKNLVLNIKYDASILSITTAVSYRTFDLDKSADTVWDKYVYIFLDENHMDFEIL